MERFTDKLDVDTKISLYEYGIIRNPKTNKCMVCCNTHELDWFGMDEMIPPIVKTVWLSFDAVKEALEEASDGYYFFIGETREDVLQNLENDYLTSYIHSLEMYNGAFDLHRDC